MKMQHLLSLLAVSLVLTFTSNLFAGAKHKVETNQITITITFPSALMTANDFQAPKREVKDRSRFGMRQRSQRRHMERGLWRRPTPRRLKDTNSTDRAKRLSDFRLRLRNHFNALKGKNNDKGSLGRPDPRKFFKERFKEGLKGRKGTKPVTLKTVPKTATPLPKPLPFGRGRGRNLGGPTQPTRIEGMSRGSRGSRGRRGEGRGMRQPRENSTSKRD